MEHLADAVDGARPEPSALDGVQPRPTEPSACGLAGPGSSGSPPDTRPGQGSAFLLAQIGAHAAARFAERITALELTPPHAGLLRAVAATPGQSQQSLAQVLGTAPSRLVSLLDQLDERGLVERRRNPDDRRLHAVHLTDAGHALMQRLGQIARSHDDALCTSLDTSERTQLRALLARIADAEGLTPGVHPGYRHLWRDPRPVSS